MMRPLDPVSYDAFVRLLARPDPVDLPRRTHVCRFEGDPNRRGTRLPGMLMAWLQRRHLEVDTDGPSDPVVPTPVGVRHAPPSHAGLRVPLRATAFAGSSPSRCFAQARPRPCAPPSPVAQAGATR